MNIRGIVYAYLRLCQREKIRLSIQKMNGAIFFYSFPYMGNGGDNYTPFLWGIELFDYMERNISGCTCESRCSRFAYM